MAVHDDSTAMKPIRVVSRISSTLKPSTPRKYCAPIDGIHACRSTNWNSGLCTSYQNHSGSDTRKPANVTMLAIHRIPFSCFPLTNSSKTAPASGVNRTIDSKGRFVIVDPWGPCPHEVDPWGPCPRAARSPRQQIQTDERENPDDHPQHVVLHKPR